MPTIRVNAIDLFYESKGRGEPILLIAGFACDATIWSKIASALAEHYRVIVFDNRGVGRSSAPDEPYTIRQLADDAAGLLQALGVDQAHIVGHSMGGQLAQELALAHPERVRSLVLIATCAKPDARNRAIIASWGELPRQVDAATGARLSLPWIYSRQFYAKPGAIEQVITLIATTANPATAHGIYHQSRAVMNFDASDRLAGIRCPTLVLVGQEDALLPVPFSEELARLIPGAELVILPATGHGLIIESVDKVTTALLAFLARLQCQS